MRQQEHHRVVTHRVVTHRVVTTVDCRNVGYRNFKDYMYTDVKERELYRSWGK